jgi:phosphoserine phosphatase
MRDHLKLALFDLDGTLAKPRSSSECVHRCRGTWEGHADQFLKRFLKRGDWLRRVLQAGCSNLEGASPCAFPLLLTPAPQS